MPGHRWARTGVLIVNPVAGGAGSELAREVTDACRARVEELDVVRTRCPGHAREAAARAYGDGVDVVVVLGGDGTTGEAAEGIARARLREPGAAGAEATAVLSLPAGTGNSFYREIWSDRPWRSALAAALAGPRPRVRGIDLARIVERDTLVLLGACSGLVAEALATAALLTGVEGRERYRRAVALTLRSFAPYPGRVTVDGVRVHEGPAVLANVGGGRYRGGGFEVLPRSVLDDGLLDVCVVGGEADLATLPGLTAEGRHLHLPGTVYARGRRIVLERTDGRPLTFEHDGELPGGPAESYTLEVLPDLLPVLAPRT